MHSGDALHKSKAALWLVIEFKGMFFPHKMGMKMCTSVIRWFSLKMTMWLREFRVSTQSVELHR